MVSKETVLNKLTYFHTVTGFPPDVLHDLLEGLVPVELSLCLGKLISAKYFTLEQLNIAIQSSHIHSQIRLVDPKDYLRLLKLME